MEIGQRIDKNVGYILKASNTIELRLYLRNSEGKLKKEHVYINTPEDYVEKTAGEIIAKLDGRIIQNDLDKLDNGISKYFVYSDDKEMRDR